MQKRIILINLISIPKKHNRSSVLSYYFIIRTLQERPPPSNAAASCTFHLLTKPIQRLCKTKQSCGLSTSWRRIGIVPVQQHTFSLTCVKQSEEDQNLIVIHSFLPLIALNFNFFMSWWGSVLGIATSSKRG